ncbi:MAG: hypothetical protein GY798_25095 [Hyphomicrobiales bacterium]|nr:hypothetical protein [Hyphomicrobiales bacterium]
MNKVAIAISILVFGSMLSSSVAMAACEPFSLIADSSGRDAAYVDVGEEGVSPGDLRVGVIPMLDESGRTVADLHWKLHILNPSVQAGDGPVPRRFSMHVLVLEDGEIHFNALPAAAQPPQDTKRRSVTSFDGVVIGGTGAYAFARGTATRTFDGEDGTLDLNIRCD